MTTAITTLVENSPGEHKALESEHGLCFHIEQDGHAILFDTGQSRAFLRNARQLGLNLLGLDHVVLSHGHYDHTGGLRFLTALTNGFKLTVGRGFFHRKFARRGELYDFLGNNFDEDWLNENGVGYHVMDEDVLQVAPGVFAVTDFSRTHNDEVVNPRFVLQESEGFSPDPFDDEVLLAVDTPRGLVVLLGCSHPGVKNMLETARTRLERPIYAVLGGTHLVESTPESIALSRQFLLDNDVKIIGVSHCTGRPGMDGLSTLHERYVHNCTGSSLFVA